MESKLSNSEITPHAIWSLEKSLMRRDRPKAPATIHSPSGLKLFPLEKANVITDCLENQFTPHDLCEEDHERRVVARIQALSEPVDNSPPERERPYEVQKIINSLKLRQAC
jgi:hypothetical protein